MMKHTINSYQTYSRTALALLLILFSCLGTVHTLQAQDDQPSFTQFIAYSALQSGRTHYEMGEYQIALRHFDKVIQLDKEHEEVSQPEVYLDRGNTLFAMGRFEDAILDYSKGISQNTRRVLSNELNNVEEVYQEEGYQAVRIVDLDRNPNLEREYALLHHNRGVAKYYLGRYEEASDDFEMALSISPDLEEAEKNLENAGVASRSNRFYEPTARQQGGSNGGNPDNANTSDDDTKARKGLLSFLKKDKKPATESVTGYDSSVSRGGSGSTDSGNRVSRSRYARKYYTEPKVAGQSYDYVMIESIEVTDRSTMVNLRVTNYTKEAFPVRLYNPGHQSAFFITDRTRSRTYQLKSIMGLPKYPQSRQLRVGEEISFTLEFERLAEGTGFIHLIEGNMQSGKEWNFYDIQLK